MLTQQRLMEFAHYDPDTGEFYRIKSMHGNTSYRRKHYKPNKHGYYRFCVDYKVHFVHKLAWLYMTAEYPDHEVDHKNGNPSDNRWNNLRKATSTENIRNRGLNSNNTSGYKGVTWNKANSNWTAQVVCNRKNHYVGSFDDKEEAAIAARLMREKLHGAFARHE